MSKKIYGLLIVVVFIVIWVGVILPEIIRVQDLQEKRANAPTYQDALDAMTLEDCESVSSGSPPAVRDRCQQIWRYTSP